MTVTVPAKYVPVIKRAASGTGLPYQVCTAQAYVESGFNPRAVSNAGAKGFWQFLPSTFREYGHGDIFNVDDNTDAYINFMRALLRQFKGVVRTALAAYNAGPGNYRAGLGYADEILRLAGEPQSLKAGAAGSSGSGTSGGSTSGPGRPSKPPPPSSGTSSSGTSSGGSSQGGTTPAPATVQFTQEPSADIDDWSWWVNQSGEWLSNVADACNYYADAIGRL